MIQAKVKINLGDIYEKIGHTPLIPITIPTMDEIHLLAQTAHTKEINYTGESWGWPVSYEAEVPEAVPHSNLQFRPAVFSIGVYPIWFVSFTSEYGKDEKPMVLVEDENVVFTYPVGAQTFHEVNGHASYR